MATMVFPYTPQTGLVAGKTFENYNEYRAALMLAKKKKGIKRTRRPARSPALNGSSMTFRQRLKIYETLVESGVGRAKAIEAVEKL